MVYTVEDARLGWFSRSNCTVGTPGVCGELAEAEQDKWSTLCKIHEAKINFAFCLNTLRPQKQAAATAADVAVW